MNKSFSLIFTPLILFVVPYVELSSNAYAFDFFSGDFSIFLSVLIPAGFVFSLGYIAQKYSREFETYCYYALGFSFIFYHTSLRLIDQEWVSITLFILPFLLYKKIKLQYKLINFLIIISIIANAVNLFTSSQLFHSTQKKELSPFINIKNKEAKLEKPNIYHIIIDEVPYTEYLNFLEKNNKIHTYKDFTFFSNMLANYSFTQGSTLSTFQGKHIPSETKMHDLKEEVLSKNDNFLQTLRDNGYLTMASNAIHNFQELDIEINSRTSLSDEESVSYFKLSKIIRYFDMYAHKYIPLMNHTYFISNIYPYDHIKDVLSFQKYLKLEKDFPAKERYTFLYLPATHFPFILNENCETDSFVLQTTYQSSLECTHKLLTAFLKTLKDLNRYDDSIIIIHSDHGRHTISFTVERLELESVNLQHPFFSLKPVKSDTLEMNNKAVQLIDLAPTILSMVDIAVPAELEGENILSPSFSGHVKRKFHYVYPFVDPKGYQFIIDKNQKSKQLKEYKIYSKFMTRL